MLLISYVLAVMFAARPSSNVRMTLVETAGAGTGEQTIRDWPERFQLTWLCR